MPKGNEIGPLTERKQAMTDAQNEINDILDSGLWDFVTDENGNTEPYFSWSECEACGDGLGGNRYDIAAIVNGNEFTWAICADCV